jgi:hypothetical protein
VSDQQHDHRDDFDDDQHDGLDEDGNIPFECSRYWIKGEGWYCPMAGTEECDWECPEA